MSSTNLDRTALLPTAATTLPQTAPTFLDAGLEDAGLEDAGRKSSLFLTSLLLTSSLVSFAIASLPQLLPLLQASVPQQPAQALPDGVSQPKQVLAFTIESSAPSTQVTLSIAPATIAQPATASAMSYAVYVIQPNSTTVFTSQQR